MNADEKKSEGVEEADRDVTEYLEYPFEQYRKE